MRAVRSPSFSAFAAFVMPRTGVVSRRETSRPTTTESTAARPAATATARNVLSRNRMSFGVRKALEPRAHTLMVPTWRPVSLTMGSLTMEDESGAREMLLSAAASQVLSYLMTPPESLTWMPRS